MMGLLERIRVPRDPLRFDRVYVPEQAYKIRTEVHPKFHNAFRLAVDTLTPKPRANTGRPIYLSRTKLTRALIVGEYLAEQAFERAGFQIVHPQLLELDEQIRLIIQAPAVAGFIGSAMHNLLFGMCPKQTICLHGTRDKNLSNFIMIDQLLGNDATYVIGARNELALGHGGPYLFDHERAFDLLEQAGILRRKCRPLFSRDDLTRAYTAEWHRRKKIIQNRKQSKTKLSTADEYADDDI
jgi:hypothetical protein